MTKRDGFTLVEVVISLIIICMTTLLCEYCLKLINQNKVQDLSGTTDWYLFVDRLENDDHQFRIIGVESDSVKLLSLKNNQEYYLKFGKTIFLRGKKGGYIPILMNYKKNSASVKCYPDQNILIVKGATIDGKKHESHIQFKKCR